MNQASPIPFDTVAGPISALAASPAECPCSAVPIADGCIGVATLAAAWLCVVLLKPPLPLGACLILAAAAVPMVLLDIARSGRPARRHRVEQRPRPLAWLLGIAVATAPLLVVHWQGAGLAAWLAAWVVAAPLFVARWMLERRRRGPDKPAPGFAVDLGAALLHTDRAAIARLAPAARLWVLKGFFVPVYALSLIFLVSAALKASPTTALGWLAVAVVFAYTIDLSFGLTGYIFASNALAPTVKSTQTSIIGWVVCLACYAPLFSHWPDFRRIVIAEIGWPSLLALDWRSTVGGLAMTLLLTLYIASTIVFGARFSNLSNRGIITAGPYRYMKHPAYVAHVGNAWILSLLLLPAAGIATGLAGLIVPIAFTILYRARAVTEERHLGVDPAYAAYAEWIAHHGLLARARAGATNLLHRTKTP